jgi:hypothetical protein
VVTFSGKLTGYVRHVDILATAVDAAGGGKRRCVFADECDLHDGVLGYGSFSAGVPMVG